MGVPKSAESSLEALDIEKGFTITHEVESHRPFSVDLEVFRRLEEDYDSILSLRPDWDVNLTADVVNRRYVLRASPPEEVKGHDLAAAMIVGAVLGALGGLAIGSVVSRGKNDD